MRYTRGRLTAGAIVLVILLVIVLWPVWFRWLGDYLVDEQPPAKADAILVLGGDWRGQRILRAGELARSGYAPKILVSGPTLLYGRNEADLAIDYAVNHGVPRDSMEPIYGTAYSTEEEANEITAELVRRRVRRLLLLTSMSHTHRAGGIYRRLLAGRNIELHVVGAPEMHFSADGWWRHREGRKILFFEWSKTIAGQLGM